MLLAHELNSAAQAEEKLGSAALQASGHVNAAAQAEEKAAQAEAHAGAEAEKAGGHMKESGEHSESLLGTLGKFGMAATGIGMVGEGAFSLAENLVKAGEKANEAQASFAILDKTLANNATGWNGNKSEIEDYVNKQKLMGFSTEDINNSLGTLVITTHSVEEAQKDQGLAMDLARAKHIDLATATKIVDKADMDSVASLKKLGIEVDKNATKEQLLAAIHKATGGAAEEWANTSEGASAKLGAVMDTLLEKVGGIIMPGITSAMSGVADFISSPGFMGAIQGVIDGITNGFTLVGQIIQSLLPIVQPFFDAVVSFWSTISSGGDIFGALGKYFSDLGSAVGNAWNIISPALGSLIQNILSWIQTNGPGILAKFEVWAQAFGSWVMDKALPAVMSALGSLIGTVWNWIVANGPGIVAQLATWAAAFAGWVLGTALPALLSALGSLIGSLWNWIVANGPGIMQQLSVWAKAFSDWVMNTALPGLMTALGNLITTVWNWIVQNGPGILQQLATWATAFGGWVLGSALPWLLQQLGSLLGSLFSWIVENGPGILGQLAVWATQFAGWVLGSALPWMLQQLGSLIGSLWNWITTNAPTILAKLQEWANQFMNWVQTQILPNLPIWLGQIASALWTWLTTTAGDLGTKLTTQWLPAFWGWINGPDGVIAHLAAKLADVASGIWDWITQTAKDALTKVLAIGQSIVDGIKTGISNGWEAFKNWVMGLLGGLLDDVKHFFGISSPSTVWAAEIGAPMANGLGVGFSAAWVPVAASLLKQMDGTFGEVQARAQQIAAMEAAAQSGGGVGSTPGGGSSGNNNYQGSYGGRNNGQAGSGGTGARSMATGFGGGVPFGGPGAGGGTQITVEQVNIYAFPGMDAGNFASSFLDALEEEVSTNVRTRRAGF